MGIYFELDKFLFAKPWVSEIKEICLVFFPLHLILMGLKSALKSAYLEIYSQDVPDFLA